MTNRFIQERHKYQSYSKQGQYAKAFRFLGSLLAFRLVKPITTTLWKIRDVARIQCTAVTACQAL